MSRPISDGFVADFETTRDVDEFGAIRMRVWLFDICTIGEPYTHRTFQDIESGLTWLSAFGSAKVYFHNLKFDGSYLLDWLFRNGYEWDDQTVNPGTFSFLISDLGVWYCGTIILKSGTKIRIYDSMKKIPLPVGGKRGIASTYGLPIAKGEIDYSAPRPVGYSPTPEELEYVRHDTEIVARALRMHFDAGMKRMTMPGDAMDGIKKTVHDPYIHFGFKFMSDHPEVDSFCREAYCGGISYVNPEIQGKPVGAGMVYDVNSLYPFVMREYEYPIRNPVKIESYMELDSCLWIGEFQLEAELIPGRLPTLRANRKWIDGTFSGRVVLTKIDFEMLLENYIVNYRFIRGYKWRDSRDDLFREFINYWGAKKEKDTGGQRYLDKLMMNSGYGKFGMNPARRRKRAGFQASEDRVRFYTLDWEVGPCANVAIAAFITAYARRELMRGVNASTGFCYCDTDSVHLAEIGGVPAEFRGPVDPVKLGCWKRESEFVRAKYLRQKTYIEEGSDGRLDVKACGMPDACKRLVTWENFRMGASYPGKLLPIMRPGGVDLVETEFTVHEVNFTF